METPGWRAPSPFKDAHHTGLPPEIYSGIGLLIERWKSVEIFCWLTISHLLKADVKRTWIAMSGMQARTMIGVLRSLVHYTDPESRTEFDKLYKRLERALAFRNEIAHSHIQTMWTTEPLHIVNKRVRLNKSGVLLESKSPITAHAIFRRSLYVKLVAALLIEFGRRYEPPLDLRSVPPAPRP